MIKQAIIPLAGLGTRLLPLTSVFAKELLPINGRPGIEYILDECIEAGIKDVVFIVGSANVFSHMFAFLRSTSTGLGGNVSGIPQSGGLGWEVGEAALFIMCAVARNLVPVESGTEETNCVSQVIDSVLDLAAT